MFYKKALNAKLILLLTLVLLFVNCINVNSQTEVSFDLLKKYAETSFRNKDYEVALINYDSLLLYDENNLNYNYRLGICYTESNLNKAGAIPYLEFVTGFNNFPEEALYYLGRAFMYNYQFTEAVEVFYEYKIVGKNEKILSEVNRLIEMSYYALEIMNQPQGVSFERLDSTINSKNDDYNPFINEEGNILIFTSDKKFVKEYQEYYEGGYISEKKKEGWSYPEELSTNNLEDKAETVGMTYNGEHILLHLDGYMSDRDIRVAKKKGKSYVYVYDELAAIINTENIEEGACISANGKTIYFASDRPGGFGGMDIYEVKNIDGRWTKPQNLGNVINTIYDENYPSLSYDEKILYFASKGFQGIGGYDLFESSFGTETQTWQRPRSLGFPINTPDDNTTISFSKDKSYAYIAANRKEGFGGLDIYKITIDDEGITKIVLGTVYIGTANDNIPYSGDIMKVGITIRDKYDNIYAKYKVEPEGGQFFASLPPGEYKLVIEGSDGSNKYDEIITITKQDEDIIMKDFFVKR